MTDAATPRSAPPLENIPLESASTKGAPSSEDSPPTGGPVVPRLALIADGFAGGANGDVAARAVEAVRAGVPWVHLRDHAVEEDAFAEAARVLVGRLREAAPGALKLSVNSRPRVAAALGAGLHTGRHGPSPQAARAQCAPDILMGLSAHERSDAEAARDAADYFFFSPVFPTTSKPGHPGTGLDALAAFCEAVPDTPVLALGGVTPGRVRPCLDAGAHGVAVLSGILHATHPNAAVHAFLRAFRDT